MKIIDSHIHVFDITRKPAWPPKESLIYKSFLAQDYEDFAKTKGIVGAVVVEASAYLADNDWVLEHIKDNDFFLAFIGNIDLASLEFENLLEKYLFNHKFKGIRAGNLWERDLARQLKSLSVLKNIEVLSDRGLILELANPNLALLKAALELKNRFLELTIILNHLPNIAEEDRESKELMPLLKELANTEKLYIKFSEIAQLSNGANRFDVRLYEDFLNMLYELFGARRILFGSDYPNSEFLGSFDEILNLAKDFLTHKPTTEQELIFYENAQKIYGGKA